MIRPFLALFPMIAELWLFMGLAAMQQHSGQQIAAHCINTAGLVGSTSADLRGACDILNSILTDMVERKACSLDTKTKYLCRAIHKYPNYELLWRKLLAIDDTKIRPRGKGRANSVIGDQNFGLFQLAVDHILGNLI